MTDQIERGSEPWQAIPRALLRDGRLSPRAKGGLVTLLSHDEGWVRSAIATLQRECQCGRAQAQAVMRELRELGYAELVTERSLGGQLVSHYVVRPEPAGSTASTSQNPVAGAPVAGEPDSRECEAPNLPDSGSRSDRPTGTQAAVEEPLDVEPQEPEPSSSEVLDVPRPDVDGLCDLLASLIEGNGVKRPTVTAKWRSAARLMLDRDGYAELQVAEVIRWVQADEFWRSNVLSMPKLREQMPRLLLRMRQGSRGAPGSRASQIRAHAEALEGAGG